MCRLCKLKQELLPSVRQISQAHLACVRSRANLRTDEFKEAAQRNGTAVAPITEDSMDGSWGGVPSSTTPLPTLSLAELAASDSDSEPEENPVFPSKQIVKPARAKQKHPETALETGTFLCVEWGEGGGSVAWHFRQKENLRCCCTQRTPKSSNWNSENN